MIKEFEITFPEIPDEMSAGQYIDVVAKRVQSIGLSFSKFECDCNGGVKFMRVYDATGSRNVYAVLAEMVHIGIRIGRATIEGNTVVLQDVVYVNGADND